MSDHRSFRDSGEPDYGRPGYGRGRDSEPDWYPKPGPWEDEDELDAQGQVDRRYGQSGNDQPGVGQPGNAPSGYAQPGAGPGYEPGYGIGAGPGPGPGYGLGYGPQGYGGPGQPTSGYPQPGYGPHGYPQGGFAQPGGYGVPGPMPPVRAPQQAEADKAARVSVICAVLGFVFPVASLILGPVAIGQANKAQRLGRSATLGKVLGWIVTLWGGLWMLGTVTSMLLGGLSAVFGY
ncbi:MAG: hypothetical protein QJR09_12560 [Micrococcus sp.]|nr:hypothetical protein [Micrococcus sp.]